MDIKPGNLLYSKKMEKIVWIDFGFSKIVKEKVGFKSLTSFAGSIGYCSLEMRKIYESKKEKYQLADLYYNDVHAL